MGFFFSVRGICSFLFPAQRLVGPLNWSGDTQLLLRNLLRPDKHGNHGTFTCKAPNIKYAPFQIGSWSHKLSQVSKSTTKKKKKKNVEFILKLVEIQKKKIKLSLLYGRVVCEDVFLEDEIWEAWNDNMFQSIGREQTTCEGDHSISV